MNSSLTNVFHLLKKWWMKFADALGWLNTRVILTLFYFTVVALGGIILKLIGKDLLDRKMSKQSSYWVAKEPIKHTVENVKHQF